MPNVSLKTYQDSFKNSRDASIIVSTKYWIILDVNYVAQKVFKILEEWKSVNSINFLKNNWVFSRILDLWKNYHILS